MSVWLNAAGCSSGRAWPASGTRTNAPNPDIPKAQVAHLFINSDGGIYTIRIFHIDAHEIPLDSGMIEDIRQYLAA